MNLFGLPTKSFASTALLLGAALLSVPGYSQTVTQLGGGLFTFGSAVNNSGEVVGTLSNPGLAPFVASGSTFNVLPLVNGFGSGVNNLGQAVGTASFSARLIPGAYLWSANSVTELGTLGGVFSSAFGINDSGQIVGSASTPERQHAFVYSGGTLTDLGTLGGNQSSAQAINAHGQVVGWSQVAGNQQEHAFLHASGTMVDVGAFAGGTSRANDINDLGHIVGTSGLSAAVSHAFLYANGMMTDLGSLGGSRSSALSISNSGLIVGNSSLANQSDSVQHGFIYRNGVMTDLNDLFSPLLSDGSSAGFISFTQANAISDNGFYVTGSGTYFDGFRTGTRAYLLDLRGPVEPPLSAVPEPSTFGLAGVLGLLGLVVRRQRQDRAWQGPKARRDKDAQPERM